MDRHFGWWVDLSKVVLGDAGGGALSWVHALPFGKYQHPLHGELNFDTPKLNALAASVNGRTRGIDPDIDYDHKEDPAKGRQAAGWVKAAQVRSDGLYLQVDWTGDAKQAIKDKKYRYFSAEFTDQWTDAQGNAHKDVLVGGGLTNRPYMKNLLPVNLSELTFGDQPTEEDEVDGKKLREALGLAADVTDEAVFAKLGDLAKTITELGEVKTKLSEAQAEITKLKAPDETDPELKKLIESSPAFAKLMDDMKAKETRLTELQEAVKLSEVNAKLSELQQGKTLALAPVARDALREVMLKTSPEITTALFELMKKVMDGSGTVDLSEKGYTGRRTDDDVDPTKRFNEEVERVMKDAKIDYGTAVERVTRANPRLYEEYRHANYTFKA